MKSIEDVIAEQISIIAEKTKNNVVLLSFGISSPLKAYSVVDIFNYLKYLHHNKVINFPLTLSIFNRPYEYNPVLQKGYFEFSLLTDFSELIPNRYDVSLDNNILYIGEQHITLKNNSFALNILNSLIKDKTKIDVLYLQDNNIVDINTSNILEIKTKLYDACRYLNKLILKKTGYSDFIIYGTYEAYLNRTFKPV